MSLKGLVVSGEGSRDTSAYTHRIRKLAECLEDRSIHCDFFFPDDTPLLNTWTTVSVLMLTRLGMLRKYDFIYAGGEEAGQALFFCKPFLRGPIVYDIHGDPGAQSALYREIESAGGKKNPAPRVRVVSWMALTCADQVVTVSNPHREAFLAEGFPEDRVSIIRNGVDLDLFAFHPMPEQSAFTFGYAGDFQAWQGMDNLIRAFDRVRNADIRLKIIGFTDRHRDLKADLERRFGSRVQLIDRVAQQMLVKMLSEVHILIIPRIDHPAIRHAFPTKFAEYAALGRPIMVNDVDETADFVRQYDCGFVSEETPGAMAGIIEFAAQKSARELAEMGKRARKMAETNFSWSKIGVDYEALVRKVVDRYRSGRE